MKKYEEQIINYLVGGIIGLIFLIPFMGVYINFIYEKTTSNSLSYLSIGSLCMLSIFILFTIASGASASRMKKNKIIILPSLIFYFKATPFISLFLFINILIGFNISILLSIIISIIIASIDFLMIKRITI